MTRCSLTEIVTPAFSPWTGFKLKEMCQGNGLRSKCEICSDGTYQDIMNHFHNCFLCRKPCNPEGNYIFIRIVMFVFVQLWKKGDTNFSFLFSYSILTDNEIEREPCTNNQDRKCGCQNEYYEHKVDDYTMSCTPCRKCGTGEIETRPCKSFLYFSANSQLRDSTAEAYESSLRHTALFKCIILDGCVVL